MTKQHANATTTPEMRAFIHESDLPTALLARLLKISEATVRKWRNRDVYTDASHTPKQLNTTLSRAQEYVVIELRTRLLLSLDELLAVSREFINPHVSRAGLQRCLKRHGVSRLSDMAQNDVSHNTQSATQVQVSIQNIEKKDILLSDISPESMREVLNQTNNLTEEQVVKVKVTQLPDFEDEPCQRRLLIANDPASGWVYVDIYEGAEKDAAARYMSYVLTKAPFHIRRILADNYSEFLSRFRLLGTDLNEQYAPESKLEQ